MAKSGSAKSSTEHAAGPTPEQEDFVDDNHNYKGIYARGDILWMSYKNLAGKWAYASTGLKVGQEKRAAAMRREVQTRIDAERELFGQDSGPLTVRLNASRWLDERRQRGLEDVDTDDGRMKHILDGPYGLGDMLLRDVRPRHVRKLIRALTARTGTRPEDMAPRTVLNINTIGKSMFDDAAADELIPTSPWKLKRGDLPKKVDKDPEWRASAKFSLDEYTLLLSLNDAVPPDRRVVNAIMGVGGPRFGGAAALCWRNYDSEFEPLNRLVVARSWDTKKRVVKRVKTGVPREVPVHPALAQILDEWRVVGWAWMMGRPPQLDDLIIPSRKGEHRNVNHGLRKLHADLDRLGLRVRRQHDLRRSFISLARDAGARKDVLQTITHNAQGNVMDMYTTFSWKVMCEAVATLQLDIGDQRTAGYVDSPVWAEWHAIHPDQDYSALLQSYYSGANRTESRKKTGGVDGTRTRRRIGGMRPFAVVSATYEAA